jgi:4'-phosphopantetheinyl transferase
LVIVSQLRNCKALPKDDGVIVVSVTLQGSEAVAQRITAYLSTEELARASRYRFDKDRRAFIASRAVLRICLAHFLTIDPRDVVFEYSSEGKPQLQSAQNAVELQFNVSHAEELVAIAIARKQRIGIDVEQTERVVDEIEIAEKYFSTAESESLRALPEAERRRAFLAYWTRKEAYAKATGRGLSDVLERSHKDNPMDPTFTFLSLSFEAGYVGVVAVEGEAKLAQHLHFTSLDDFFASM